MKKSMLIMGLVMGLFSGVSANDNSGILNATAFEMVGIQSYTPSGYFYEQDFDPTGDKSPFDWAFETPNGKCYQLQGNTPTDDNLFGWKPTECATNPTKSWVMIQVGDTDGDGKSKFDWVLLSTNPDKPAVYKLMGVEDNGTFAYSDKMAVDYNITVDENNDTVIVVDEPRLEAFDIADMLGVNPYITLPSSSTFVMSQTALVTIEKISAKENATIMVNGKSTGISEMIVEKGSLVGTSQYTSMIYNNTQSWMITITLGHQVLTDTYRIQTKAPPSCSSGKVWNGNTCITNNF